MPGIFNVTSPSLGGIVRATSRPTMGAPARGVSASNAAARQKAATNAAAEASRAQTAAQTQQTANVTPSVAPIAGRQPVTQGAYEQQAQTQLQATLSGQQQQQTQQFQGGENAADRQHALTVQERQAQAEQAQMQTEAAARQKEMEASAAAQRGEMELAARLSAEADTRRLGQISTLASMPMPGGDGGGGAAPSGPDPAAARAAIFAREKDRIGQIGRASLDALANVMQSRGMSGSGVEAGATAGLLGDVNSDLVDVVRDQTIDEAGRAAEVEDRNYSGNLAKRNQDLNWRQSLLSLMGGRGAY